MIDLHDLGVGGRMQVDDRLLRDADAEDIPDVGFFSWDIAENIVYADSALADLFGIDRVEAGHGLPIETFLARVHPDDRPRLARVISRSITEHVNQQETYRVKRRDNSYVRVESFARGFRDRDGIPVRYVGIVVQSAVVSLVNQRANDP